MDGKPKTASEKIKNKETLELAEKIKSIREAEYYTGKFGLVDNSKLNTRFIDYFEKLKEERSSYISNYGTWLSTKKYIDEYVHPSTTFREVTVDFIKGFKRYLDSKPEPNTVHPWRMVPNILISIDLEQLSNKLMKIDILPM